MDKLFRKASVYFGMNQKSKNSCLGFAHPPKKGNKKKYTNLDSEMVLALVSQMNHKMQVEILFFYCNLLCLVFLTQLLLTD